MWKRRGCAACSISGTKKVAYQGTKGTAAQDGPGFHTLLNARSPSVDSTVIDKVKVWPPCTALGAVPSMTERADVARPLANRKAVGPDKIWPNCQSSTLIDDDNDDTALNCLRHTTVVVWNVGGVPQKWKDAIVTVLHKTKMKNRT